MSNDVNAHIYMVICPISRQDNPDDIISKVLLKYDILVLFPPLFLQPAYFVMSLLFVWCFRSGMLESGVDRIITQVVDPKMNHTFRPHIETAIHDFLSGERREENASSCNPAASEQTEPPEVPPASGPKTP